MDMDKQEFDGLVMELLESGYKQSAPEGADIDAAIIVTEACPNCGGSMDFRPFQRPGSYRAFAACRTCGAFEF